MTIFDIFSKRQKRLRGDIPDVYTYDELPDALIVQIVHIWSDVLGTQDQYFSRGNEVNKAYRFIVKALRREYGLFVLPGTSSTGNHSYISELTAFLLQESDTERCLDAVELSFRVINKRTRSIYYLRRADSEERADKAIAELNSRFNEHGVGYQFVENQIIRVDSELVHSEAVKPALRLLNTKGFEGAQQEFLAAYEHYGQGKHKEALNECLKSFESTMKSICEKRKWGYGKNATAKTLIDICFANNLIPDFWQQQFASLRSLLESSVPTGRNKLSGHGQGPKPTEVPDYLVVYMLHMTASTLVFLVQADENIA